MTRIAALNDWSVGSSEEEDVGPTREALEAQATKSYNEAITHLAHDNLEKAYENFCLVLQNPYIEKACWPEGVVPGGTLPQDVALRYSCLKNLGNLAAKQGDYEQAAKHYLEAVQLDNTEVTVWQRLGAAAIKLKDFELALVAFQEGLNINPKHWPCLDQLLSILFILEMYMDCLGLIIMALKRDPCYTKANAFKDKIFELQPSLLKDVKCFFRDSDVLFHNISYDRAQGDKFIQTCEALRPPCKTPRPTSPFQFQQLRKPLPKLTWSDLAQALIHTYDILIESDGLAFAARIDIHEALKIKDEEYTDVGKNMDTNGENAKITEENQQQEGKNANFEKNEHNGADCAHQEHKEHSKSSVEVDSYKQLKKEINKENGNTSKVNKSPASDGGVNASNVELSDNSLTPRHIPSRRQTIELGESQDSFRVSEKRRSVDSDTFSHPEDDLKGEEEGLNEAGKAALSNGFNAATLGVEKNVYICESKMKDSEKTATEAKHSVEAGKLEVSTDPLQKEMNSTKDNDEARNIDQTSNKRKITEPDTCITEDNAESKRHKVTEPHEKESCSGDDNQGRSSEKLVSDTLQSDNGKQGTRGDDTSQMEGSEKVVVCESPEKHSIETDDGQKNLNKESSQMASKEETGNSQPSETDNVKVRKDGESSQQGASKRKNKADHEGSCVDDNAPKEKECPSPPQDTEAEANVSREVSDQEEGVANDMEEEKREVGPAEGMLAEVEQDIEYEDGELRDVEDEEGLEDEEEEEGEEGLLSSEATETEEAVNTLKGIMALQPTEILGLPEPDFDYENEYAEYFDGGVYEEEDEMYQEENEMEDGEGMEPVEEEMEQVEGIEEIDGMEQAEEIEQVCDAGQMEEGNEIDEQEEMREGNVEQGQERVMDKADGEPDEENRTENEAASGEERIEEEREIFEDRIERAETGKGAGLGRDDEETDIERGIESCEGSNQDMQKEKERPEKQQHGTESSQKEIIGEVKDKHYEERNTVREPEYREVLDGEDQDDVTAKEAQKDNQNEDEEEEQDLREKRNSTEDETVQGETDTDAEASKTEKAGTNEKNEKTSETGENKHSQNGQGDENTAVEVSNKSEEPQAENKVVRKPKRHKRGLERELEQLDYWGRRQERDAKRRRRTISSKLLGTIEEAEYLTWGDLLRSFVPTSLLSYSPEEKCKSDEKSNTSLPSSKVSSEAVVSPSVQNQTQLNENSLKAGEELNKKGEAASVLKSVLPHAAETDKYISNFPTKEVNSIKLEVQGEELMDADQSGVKDTEKCENGNIRQESEVMNGKEITDIEKPKVDSGNRVWTTNKEREYLILSPSATEEEQVEAFLLRYEENGGILDLLQPFLTILWKRHDRMWPKPAAKIFTDVYPRVRNHVMHEEPLSIRDDPARLYQDSMLTLTHWELMVSLYHTARSSVPTSQLRSIDNPFSRECPHLEEDLLHLNLMLGRGDVWAAEAPQFHTRVRWLQAQVRLGQDQPEQAVACLHLLLCDLERLAEPGTEYVVGGVHVEGDGTVVSNSEVRRNLNFLQRSHMLEQVVDNYTDGRYHVVAELLTTIFHEPPPKSRPGVTLPTRQTQLAILIDSLFKLKDYKGVISWGAKSLEEALMRFNRAEAEEEKNRWAKTLMKISDTMNTTLKHHITYVEVVSRERLVQLVTTLIAMLVIQLEKSPNASVLPFETLSPWILLHRMLAHEEQLQKQAEKEIRQDAEGKNSGTSQKVLEDTNPEDITTGTSDANDKIVASEKEEVQPESKGPIVPHPSTLFLITAHDELGKHSWCSFDDGVLLLYCLDVLVEEVQRGLDTQYHQLLVHTLEQVTFCLYSQPSRKSKHKHLRDHGVQQIGLCWERALQLYRFYCPPQLPDFQSSQIPSVTDDVATLYKRIFAQFPEEILPENYLPSVEAYIKGEAEECNFSPANPPSDVVRDCFYLLGDYYFKNKEWNNAIKYYKLDLTTNLDRLESWAPVGLAMKAILETQLNSCEVIQDEAEFFSMAQAATRCFSQALKLDEYHTNLWVEFGGLVYMVHSHASRLLKQDLNPDISLDTFELLEKLKGEMLTQAEVCFTKALTIQEEGWDDESLPDERWLHCYMLGKVAEKQAKPPEAILQYYIKASEHLHLIQAKYPSKINYNSPQEYAVEALEMYYRGHAYILKYLQQREGKNVEQEIIKTFTRFLDKFAAGPFARCQERKYNADRNGTSASDVPGNMDSNHYGDDESSLKRQRDEQEGETEPAAKRVDTDGTSYGLRDAMKNIVIEMVYKAVILSCEMKAKESEEGKVKDGSVVNSNETTAEKDKRESDDEIQVVEEKVIERNIHISMIGRCVGALKLCLSRFPQHYKTIYRLAHYYNSSKFCKDSSRSRNYLLGCDFWQRVGYMPVNGLFYERKVWIQQPRNCNFFHGVWRIPNDEVDRPGSFAAHMYRCVSLTLDVLPQMKDFYSVLQIALALKNSPEKDKKYLRDNERELLSEHATQLGLQTMKDKYKLLFKDSSPIHGSRCMTFLLDVFRCYKQISKHLPGSEPHLAKMLTDSYAAYRGFNQENRVNILREADAFCTRNQHLQHRITTVPPTGTNQPGQLGQPSQPSSMNEITSASRRGRPPGTGRGRGRGRGALFTPRNVSNHKVIQEAYKLYENLYRLQCLLSSKTLDQAATYTTQKELEFCQAELLKYLRYPSVAQYFHNSLQGMGTNKLPPPHESTAPSSTQAQVVPPSKGAQDQRSPQSGLSQQRPTLSALAARSQAHGISITSVPSSKASNLATSRPLKPSMSVTVSPVKSTCPSVLQGRGEISVISVSRAATSSKATPTTTTTMTRPSVIKVSETSTTSGPSAALTTKPSASSPKTVSSQPSTSSAPSSPSVPKLPAGTTLTRPRDSPNKSTGPRPQLQAQARPAKTQNEDSALDGISSPIRKTAVEMMSSTNLSTTRPMSVSNNGNSAPSGPSNKPSLPKGMTITPAPRIKSKALLSPTKGQAPSASSSSSYLGAFKTSLGLGGTKAGAGRGGGSSVSASVVGGEGRGTTSAVGKKQVTQLSTSQLMQLAYGRGTPSGNISGLLSQISKKHPTPGEQSRPQPRHPGPMPQRFPSPALSRSLPNFGQRGTQLRPGMQVRPSQARQFSPGKSLQNKPAQSKGGSSDDIITLD